MIKCQSLSIYLQAIIFLFRQQMCHFVVRNPNSNPDSGDQLTPTHLMMIRLRAKQGDFPFGFSYERTKKSFLINRNAVSAT